MDVAKFGVLFLVLLFGFAMTSEAVSIDRRPGQGSGLTAILKRNGPPGRRDAAGCNGSNTTSRPTTTNTTTATG